VSTPVRYGDHEMQVLDLHLPVGTPPSPVAFLFHGGFWTAMFARDQLEPVVQDLLGRGYAVANVDFRGIGDEGGGWPGTFLDVCAGIDAVSDSAEPWRLALDLNRVLFMGHSAGGHIALFAAARHELDPGIGGRPDALLPSCVVSLAGVIDLRAADDAALGREMVDPNAPPPPGATNAARRHLWPQVGPMLREGAVAALLGGHGAEFDRRVGMTSPAELVPARIQTWLLHGEDDAIVPVSISKSYAETARAAGDEVNLVTIDGGGHFTVLNTSHPKWREVMAQVDRRLNPGC
jgi:acetyl esterase/lipase